MKRKSARWNRKSWASWSPNGIGFTKPNHYLEMLKIVWRNRRSLRYAWRILSRGVCDGCALGVAGFKDWTIKGIHLCSVRLNLLELNTIGPLNARVLTDVASLARLSSRELRELGRLPYPMLRRKGDAGFARVAWDEALDLVAGHLRETDPRRMAFYLTARGLTNETYYAAQKAVRFLGSNNIDNAARVCHAPSTVALKRTLGVAATTCSYKDWFGTDLLVIVGSDTPNNQPVTTKYMTVAKRLGTRILVVNTYREPGLARYWVPSDLESAVFGTKLADEFFMVNTGGDAAFFNGALKRLIETGQIDRRFITEHTNAFDDLSAAIEGQSWEFLEEASGSSREAMSGFADQIGRAETAVFVWSMGITQHRSGVANVEAIVNLALSRGFIGRERCGLMPIRGHSGVQGGAEMGAYSTVFPGGVPITTETAREFSDQWGFDVPDWPGLSAAEVVEAAGRGEMDVLYSVGGNFLETLPQPDRVADALRSASLRVHQDIVLTSQMLVEPADTVVLLPATTRYEQVGGGTQTTTERRVLFSPEVRGPRIAEARSEWQVFTELAQRVLPERASLIRYETAQQIRDEIARMVPFYDGIQNLSRLGDQFQWGGSMLCRGAVFPTVDGRARFSVVVPPDTRIPPGKFRVSTRRGKQFNSMVHGNRDPLNGASRDAVLMCGDDARSLSLRNDDPVRLISAYGVFEGIIHIAPVQPRNLQVHWPEGNVLVAGGDRDISGAPDYNAVVEVVPVSRRRS